MKLTSKANKPKSKWRILFSKRRIAKILKKIRKKHQIPKKKISFNVYDPVFQELIKKSLLRPKNYDSQDSRFNGVHGYFFILQDYEWLGLLTLKFHSHYYSKDDRRGEGRKNRFNFINQLMDNLRIKLGISNREFNWFACEEFGFTGDGHIHVLFSFDYLEKKNRMDKVKISDYSEFGHFYQEGRESVNFVSKKLGLNPKSVDFHWRPTSENKGLVNYFCKLEFGREDKYFSYSKYWGKLGLHPTK